MQQLTYGKLDQLLRGLGFSARVAEDGARVYKHRDTGAGVVLPGYPDTQEVYPWHIGTTRVTLEGFGIPCPTELAEPSQRAS
jgi:hypothetical protein